MTHGGGGGGISGRGDRGWCCSYSTRAAISTVSHQGTGRRENRAESLRRSPADCRGPTSLCRRRWNHLCCCVPLSEGPTLRPLTRKRGREHGLFPPFERVSQRAQRASQTARCDRRDQQETAHSPSANMQPRERGRTGNNSRSL